MADNNEWLKANTSGPVVGVDREAGILRGYVVAQAGPFKDGRGEFNKAGLREIVRLMKQSPNGLKSKFSHPTESDDGLGKFLGRAKNPRLEEITAPRDSEGSRKDEPVLAVRADLHFDKTALDTPPGGGGKPYGVYVMDLAESDPNAMSSSLQLQVEQEYRIDKEGRPKRDEDGRELPPLWTPTALHASDIVDTGDAVDGILSATEVEGLDITAAHRGVKLLDRQFKGQSREEIKARLDGFVGKYLEHRFGKEELPAPEESERRLARMIVTPDLIVSLGAGDFTVVDNRLPEDVQIVGLSINKASGECGAFEVILSSERFGVVDVGADIPAVPCPQIDTRSEEVEQGAEESSEGPECSGAPEDLRRKMRLRERKRQTR